MTETAAMTEDKLPFFVKQNTGFGRIRPEDDLLHPASFADIKDDSATETQAFGFSVPEARVYALSYLWHHPNLKVCTGGLFVCQGVMKTMAHAELCDWRNFMSDKALANDLHEFRFDSSYGVKILEPLKRFHLTYKDKERNNSVDLIAEAVLPPVMFADEKHFEQTMRMKGTLVLRGKEYAVDCYTVRDRSWGKPRPEAHMPFPPVSWMVGTFSDDFSFNCNMFDHTSGNPELPQTLVVPDEKALIGGWVYRDGKLGRIVRGFKRVTRERGSLLALAVELQFTDEHGRNFDLRGTLLAACPLIGWNNTSMMMHSLRWECDGKVGYGDTQDVFWNDYLYLSRRA